MSATDAFETELLRLILNNDSIAGIGDAGGLLQSAADGSLFLSLHTADPGETGTQSSSEAAYTGYARVAVARDGSAWTINAGSGVATNAALIQFAQCTGGTATVTHLGIGTSSSGAGALKLRVPLAQSFAISNGIRPQFAVGALTVSCS